MVAAACILASQEHHALIRDSKQLTPEQREEAFRWLTQHAVFGIGMVPAGTIDRIGILPATEQAMQQAVMHVSQHAKPTFLLVDGRDHFWFDIPHASIVRGDESEPCIAAASIVAKVTRDRLMTAASSVYAPYGFSQHKGYGTEAHFAAIQEYGVCAIHRRTFLTKFEIRYPKYSTVG